MISKRDCIAMAADCGLSDLPTDALVRLCGLVAQAAQEVKHDTGMYEPIYPEFVDELRKHAFYETIYTDSEGHEILVVRTVVMVKFIKHLVLEEIEACAKRLEAVGCDHCAANIRLRGQA